MKVAVVDAILVVILSISNGAVAFSPLPNPNRKSFSTGNLIGGSTTTPRSTATPVEEIDTDTAFASSTFRITPDDLVLRAKEVLGPDIGIGTKDGGACIAEDFEFCAPVVGPLPKDEYLDALGNFQLEEAFDIRQNFFGFTVDPTQSNRVYFFSRQEAEHVGVFAGVEPTGKVLLLPPQCLHLDFNESGQVTEFGFYTVDRRQGNTGGLGGAFGYFYGVGKPLPIRECQPFKPSFRFRMLQKLGALGRRFQRSKKEEE